MPTTKRTIAAAALLLTLTAVLLTATPRAIAEDPKTRGKDGDALTALTIGNTWVYESDSGNLISTDRVEGVVLFDGKPWHLLRTYEREKDQPATEDVNVGVDLWLAMIDGHESDAFTDTGVDDDRSSTLKLGTINKYFRYPATLGDTYRPTADDPTITVTITALNEKVTTHAGEFDCVVYKEANAAEPGYSFTAYVAPGVGVVKHVTIEDGETHTTQLTSYKIADKK